MTDDRVKVVARYRDGRIVKGFTQNFFHTKDLIHLFPPENPSGPSKGIIMNDLKAVFFVRDFEGDPRYRERKRYLEGEKPWGHRIEVTFSDGEVLVGSSLGYGPNRPGFFVVPADPGCNNIRVFVVTAAIEKVRRL